MNKFLLPNGFFDYMGNHAVKSEKIRNILIEKFVKNGYELTFPSLFEFCGDEKKSSFKIFDPLSNEIVYLRNDITPQINRIVSGLKTNNIKRICYAGDVFTSTPSEIRHARQITQYGCEIIGSSSINADIEILEMTVNSMHSLGIDNISIDFCFPKIVEYLSNYTKLDKKLFNDVILTRDITPLLVVCDDADIILFFEKILKMEHLYKNIIATFKSIFISDEYQDELDKISNFLLNVEQKFKGCVNITLDLLEIRDFEFHTGICFNVYNGDNSNLVAKGGRYETMNGLPAVGMTMYGDILIKSSQINMKSNKIYVTISSLDSYKNTVKNDDVIVKSLGAEYDNESYAKQIGCNYILIDNELKKI